MAEPTFTNDVTPSGKPHLRMFWYFNGEKIRKTFPAQKAADKWVRNRRKGAGVVERSLMDTDGPEQADIITALKLSREHAFTLTEAARAYIEAQPAPMVTVTLEEAEKEFYIHCRRENVRPITITKYEQAFRMLRAKVAKPATEISRSDINQFLDNPDWSFATRNWYLRHCRTMFNWLLANERIAASPFAGIKQKRTDEKAPCILTVKQTDALMKASAKSDKGTLPYLAIGIFAGVRPAGIERLTWEDIDLRQKVIQVPGSTNKTRDRYVCEMQPNLVKWLRTVKGAEIIPTNLRKRYEAVRTAAKIEWATTSCATLLPAIIWPPSKTPARPLSNSDTKEIRPCCSATTGTSSRRWRERNSSRFPLDPCFFASE